MLWKDGRRSDNVEDERGSSGGGMRIGGGKLGIGTIIGVLAVSYFTGQNPLQLLGMLQNSGITGGTQQTEQVPQSAESNEQADFVSVILASTEDTWPKILAPFNKEYVQPKLKLFTGQTETACGAGQAAMGPFYCPADQKVYLDLEFFEDLQNKMGAGGDFARAYVIGHEIGHHVQNLLGTSTKVHQAQQQLSEAEGNQLSVKLELQADCYAGVWAKNANSQKALLESGDIEEAINAAAAVGDDRLLQSAGRAVNPENFTHGSSKARMQWFNTGITTGDLNACNTFKS